MIKSELIAALASENPHLTQKDIERVVGVILEQMIEALEAAEEKEAIEQYGSSDSGASLGDILGAALREKASKE